jgi:hypothetical protein
MLREFAPMHTYQVNPVVGLPQDNFDSSRIIAHSFLNQVDKDFQKEGEAGRYSRYMDDIVVGAKSAHEGSQLVSRVQKSFEAIGLYANASKTRIVERSAFLAEMMKEENDFIGEIEDKIKEKKPIDPGVIESRRRAFLKMTPRPRAWERVLRRYYSLSRKLQDPYLMRFWGDHLSQYPGSTRNILDYSSTFVLTTRRIDTLKAAIGRDQGLYEDISFLALQYLAVSPSQRSMKTNESAIKWAKSIIRSQRFERPRLAAAAVVVVAKFGEGRNFRYIENLFHSDRDRNGNSFRRQLAVILWCMGRISHEELLRFGAESPEADRASSYLEALSTGEDQAVRLLLGTMEPKAREEPKMWMIPPRTMFLAKLDGVATHKSFLAAQRGWRRRIATRSGPRDIIGELWLGL